MVGIGGRNSDRTIEVGEDIVGCFGLGLLDAALHLTDRIEILVDLAAIVRAELVLEARDIVLDPIKQAGALTKSGAAVFDAATLAEKALENDARVRFGRERRRGRGPREIVLVDTGEAVVTLADHRDQIHRQLKRRQSRFLTDLIGGDLIDGCAEVVVGAFGPLGFGGAEKGGVRRSVGAGVGVLQLHVCDGRDVVPD